jgi:hypothetical protein
VKLFSSKRHWAIAAVIVLLLFLLRPGVSRLKSRIILSVSSGVGRPVDIGSVHFQLLPRPGFNLENLVVYDDAAFGAEPMLRAGQVTAALRLTSLMRGRLEISRLDMTEPSLNLVRGPDGHWNLEKLLQHTAQVPLAPTAKASLEPRPGFPYIECSSGRINFMVGREKKPYAFTNADFSLWQESENTWGVRLNAQPTRTDLNLNDTGILRVSGTWRRAASLGETPLDFSVEWDRPQLGQMTKFLTGVDQGWRGAVQLAVTINGTPAKIAIASDASVEDFRRYDITSGDALRLAAHCDAQYSSVEHGFSDILCNAPVRDGIVSLKGAAGLPGSQRYDLLLGAEHVPAGALVRLFRRAKKNLPDDLVIQGTLHGSLKLERNREASINGFEGRGEIEGFQLTSAANKAEVAPETVPFVFTERPSSLHFAATTRAFHKKFPDAEFGTGAQLVIGPFAPGVGKLTVGGWIDRGGYKFWLAGESEIGKTLATARLVGIPALQTSATGDAQSELQIHGSWPGWGNGGPQNFSGPQVTGSAQLRNVRMMFRGTEAPVEVISADTRLLSDSVRVQKLSAKVANSVWSGSLEMPRGCGNPPQCEIHFSLKSSQTAVSDLAAWAHPTPKSRPWYRMLEGSSSAPPFLGSLHARGRVAAEQFQIHSLSATHVTATLALNNGDLTISDLSADVLGGNYSGQWETDFQAKPPLSTSRGSLKGVSLAEVARLTKASWISGTANGTYQFTARSVSAGEFWQSADGSVHFEVRNGVLSNLELDDPEPLTFTEFSGQGRLHAGEFEIKDAQVASSAGTFLLSGVASAKRELQFKLLRGGTTRGFAITGTLAAPHVSALSSAEQARLKR